MQRNQELLCTYRLLTREIEDTRDKMGKLLITQNQLSRQLMSVVDEMNEIHKDMYRTIIQYEDDTHYSPLQTSIMDIDRPFETYLPELTANRDTEDKIDTVCTWQGNYYHGDNELKMVGPMIIEVGDIEEFKSFIEGHVYLVNEEQKSQKSRVHARMDMVMKCVTRNTIDVKTDQVTADFKTTLRITNLKKLKMREVSLTYRNSKSEDYDQDMVGNFVYKNGMARMNLVSRHSIV